VSLPQAIRELATGGVVAAATETFFGLLADAESPEAITRVIELKRRDPHQGISLLLPDPAAWSRCVASIPEAARRLADRFWPGPLTIALPARAELDPRLVVRGTVAVRLPGPSEAAEIARGFGRPLTATSANVTGTPPLVSAAEVRGAFAEEIDAGRLFVTQGHAPGGAPSTLVLVEGDRVRVLRTGAIATEAIDAVVPVV
jgi:L-threonylcarbamoyladenylate synthase